MNFFRLTSEITYGFPCQLSKPRFSFGLPSLRSP